MSFSKYPAFAIHHFYSVYSWLGIFILVVMPACGASPPQRSPEQIVRIYWESIMRHDYEKAWTVVCKAQKAEITKEQFMALQKNLDENKLYKVTAVVVEKVEDRGDHMLVYANLKTDTIFGPRDNKDSCKVIKENGDWGFVLSDRFLKDAGTTRAHPQPLAQSFSEATHGQVMVMTKNWDADADDDGLVIYPGLKNVQDEPIKFEGVNLPVQIKIYTVIRDEYFKENEDRLVYSGTGSIDNWTDGNPFFNGGLQVPFENIKVTSSDNERGVIYATVLLPDGRTIEAKTNFVKIKP